MENGNKSNDKGGVGDGNFRKDASETPELAKEECGHHGHSVKLPCDHTVVVPCCKDPLAFPCPQPCDTIVEPCGHACLLKCHVREDGDHIKYKCKKKIVLAQEMLVACGHTIKQIECHDSQKAADDQDLIKNCDNPCGVVLRCGHGCSGTCGECSQGRFHKRCSDKCGVPMVCNHLCQYPCRKACRTCLEPCPIKCSHGRCNKLCGEVCTPCNEPCSRNCPHSRCTNSCSQPCSVSPCEEPCEQLLKCGHECTGFCGDPCLSLCKKCLPDEFGLFFGTEDIPDARFVQLQDCLHIVESSGMVQWLEQGSKSIGFKVCPKCKAPIKTTQRYGDYVRNADLDVVRVKVNLAGSPEKNEADARTLSAKVRAVKAKQQGSKTGQHASIVVEALDGLIVRLERMRDGKRQTVDKILLNAIASKVLLIERLIEATGDFGSIVAADASVHETECINAILEVVVWRDLDYITDQEIDDASGEIDRLAKTISFSGIDRTAKKWKTTIPADIAAMLKRCEALAFAPKAYTHDEDREFQRILEKLRCHFDVTLIPEAERRQVLKAMAFPIGHWFKCPNGHVYAIGDCGGATEKSVCHECGEEIGGTSHRLLDSNALASEMDGAIYAAYSETANDLANFDLNNLY